MKTYTAKSGRVFEWQHTKPYTRKDGSATELDVWASTCAHPGCETEFTVTVPLGSVPDYCKAFGTVHCKAHKLTAAEVTQRWAAACSTANTRISDTDLAELIAHRQAGLSCATLSLMYPVSENHIRRLTKEFVTNRKYTRRSDS